MNHQCPMCQRALTKIGRLIAYRDDVGQHFSFAICDRCLIRLTRLPRRVAQRQENAALGLLARNPDRYQVQLHDSAVEAHLFISLEVERLSSAPS